MPNWFRYLNGDDLRKHTVNHLRSLRNNNINLLIRHVVRRCEENMVSANAINRARCGIQRKTVLLFQTSLLDVEGERGGSRERFLGGFVFDELDLVIVSCCLNISFSSTNKEWKREGRNLHPKTAPCREYHLQTDVLPTYPSISPLGKHP